MEFAHPLAVDEVAVEHREVTFVICHLGNPWFTEAMEVVYKNELLSHHVAAQLRVNEHARIAYFHGRNIVRTVNPYTPAPQDDELDVSSLLTPPVARIGGGLSLLSGIITALTSLQTLSIVNIRGPVAAAPYLLLVLGVATAIAGGKLLDGHGRAAIAATALNALLFLASGAWLVFSFLNGLFSLFALVDPGLALIAGAVALASIVPCGRVTAARKESEQQGFGLGI